MCLYLLVLLDFVTVGFFIIVVDYTLLRTPFKLLLLEVQQTASTPITNFGDCPGQHEDYACICENKYFFQAES